MAQVMASDAWAPTRSSAGLSGTPRAVSCLATARKHRVRCQGRIHERNRKSLRLRYFEEFFNLRAECRMARSIIGARARGGVEMRYEGRGVPPICPICAARGFFWGGHRLVAGADGVAPRPLASQRK